MKKTSVTLEKILNWEHWPSSMFYVPNLPYAFYLAYKAKSLTFFTAANPAIKSSGNGTESKYKTIQLVPEKHRPKSVLVTPKTNFKNVREQLKEQKITYPLIAKPDIGFRGLLVKKIFSEEELQNYLKKYPLNIIIQEFLDYENECGVFYHRLPNASKGKITSLTLKEFITVTGNGSDTLNNLILNNNRAVIYYDLFKEIHQKELNSIPENGKKIKLTAIGNHSKGTQFINGNHLITKELEKTFDKLNKNINGWYYGRIDLKYNSFNELEKGTDFKVIEINGIMAEPTHIYDSKNYSYLEALKTIRNHWKSLFEISSINHKEKNTPYKKTSIFLQEISQLRHYISDIKRLNT